MRYFLVIVALLLMASACWATTYYVTESGDGSANGTSLGNAWSAANFNNAANWDSSENAAKIDPGDTVMFDGNFTTELFPKGSGTSDSYIVLDGQDAIMQQDVNATGSSIYTLNVQYITFQNIVVDGQDDNMTFEGSTAALYFREFGSATGNFTVQDCNITNSCAGILLQGSVSNVDIYRNKLSNMSNTGINLAGDDWDGDGLDGYDDCPSYVTIGGSSANGNTFYNVGKLTAGETGGGAVPGYMIGTTANDTIISYNNCYADLTDVGAGIYMNGAKRILVEYNSIHSLESEKHRSYITFKCDNDLYTEDIIIRFNNIYDVYDGDNQYASPGDAIRISGEGEHVVVHGNYCEEAGINLNWNWTADNDGVGGDGYFVWANVINKTAAGGGISLNGASTCTDIFKNYYIYNNTVYRATQTPEVDSYFYGICTSSYAATMTDNVNIKNNLIVDSRPDDTDYINLAIDYDANVTADYNHHHFTGETPLVCYYDSDNCSNCTWSSANVPDGYGDHDSAGDPSFTNTTQLSLNAGSLCINAGTNLLSDNSALPTITIQGIAYTFDFATALSPETDWTTTPPTVHTIDQDIFQEWEIGAYIRPYGAGNKIW